MVFTSTSPWKPKNVIFFSKVGNWRKWILSVPRVSIRREKKSPWLCQYQSYNSMWYVNGKAFEYYNMGTKNLIFFSKKFEIEFDLCWRAEINIQVGLTYMSTSGMHRRPFEGRHLVLKCISPYLVRWDINTTSLSNYYKVSISFAWNLCPWYSGQSSYIFLSCSNIFGNKFTVNVLVFSLETFSALPLPFRWQSEGEN